MDTEFLAGVGVGAVGGWFFGKIIPLLLKHWLSTKSERKKAAIIRCDAVSDSAHKILKQAAIVYCGKYDLAKSLQLKTDFKEFAILIKELNNDLIFIGKSELVVDNSLIIDFRQKITGNAFSLREDVYLYTDPLINDIESVGERVVEKFRNISRELR